MRMVRLLCRELRHRVGNVFLGALAVAAGVSVWAGTVVVLRGYDARTTAFLEQRREQLETALADLRERMRKATLKLSFNLLILPRGQDLKAWHTDGEITGTMPEDYVHQLAQSGIVTVQHFLPIVQKRVWWEEKGRRIVLVGSRGEVPNAHSNPKKPLVQPVPPGTIVLGHELHRSLTLVPGDEVTLMGRTFSVHRCHEERGSIDDITAWIYLPEAQELFGMQGRIHAILALECMCAGMPGVDTFRAEIGRVLPNTDVVELGTKALARAEARLLLGKEARQALADEENSRLALRQAREGFVAALLPVSMLLTILAVAALSVVNVRQRTPEFALLRALGVGGGRILVLVLSRYVLAAVPGAVAGCLVGMAGGAWLAGWLDPVPLAGSPPLLGGSEAAATILAALAVTAGAAWFPALVAARRDPADILSRV
ncbi:MAG: FtsX-like permease family protein [Lentisphaeria bacterium]|nr:FtsX-like permease family protein [Lentisphaeria bacterium]